MCGGVARALEDGREEGLLARCPALPAPTRPHVSRLCLQQQRSPAPSPSPSPKPKFKFSKTSHRERLRAILQAALARLG